MSEGANLSDLRAANNCSNAISNSYLEARKQGTGMAVNVGGVKE